MTNRRKILIVNIVQQRRLIMGCVLSAILLTNSLAIYTVFLNPDLLAHIETYQTLMMAGLELIIAATAGYLSLMFSHRLAGPAFAITRDLKKLACQIRRDLTVRTHLRKGDFHTEIADALNLSSETLCAKLKSVKTSLTALQQQTNGDENAQRIIEALLRELAYFKTEPTLSAQARSAPNKNVAGEEIPALGMENPPSGR